MIKKAIKTAGFTVIGILAVLYIAFLIFPFFVNSYIKSHNTEITEQIEHLSGFKVILNDLKLVTTPKLTAGIKLSHAELSPQKGANIASLDDFEIKLSLIPLLIRRIELDKISAENIKIYHTTKQNSRELTSITQANEGYFDNNEWNLINPRVSTLPQSYALGQEGMQTKEYENIKILKGFRPKILDTFYNNKPIISLTDAIYSLKILLQEQADTKRTRGVLYTLGIVPFFISMLAVIIAYYAPPLARYGNLATLGIGLSVLSLIIWGLFFSLGKLNANAIFLPEVSMLLPLGILLIISIWYYNRLNKI